MIRDWQAYGELYEMVDAAEERLRTGSGESGIHYTLIGVLRWHGIRCHSREEAIRAGRQLLREFETAQEAR